MLERGGTSWAFISIVGAFAAGLIVSSAQIFICEDWSLGWEMLSALGTFSAVFVALFVSVKEAAERRSRERMRSLIVARRILDRVRMLSTSQLMLDAMFGHIQGQVDSGAPIMIDEKSIEAIGPNHDERYSDEDLLDMQRLDNRLPALLIASLSEFRFARAILAAAYRNAATEQRVPELINGALEDSRRYIRGIRDLLFEIEVIFREHGVNAVVPLRRAG